MLENKDSCLCVDTNGFMDYYKRVNDLGLVKCKSPVTDENIKTVFEMAKTLV